MDHLGQNLTLFYRLGLQLRNSGLQGKQAHRFNETVRLVRHSSADLLCQLEQLDGQNLFAEATFRAQIHFQAFWRINLRMLKVLINFFSIGFFFIFAFCYFKNSEFLTRLSILLTLLKIFDTNLLSLSHGQIIFLTFLCFLKFEEYFNKHLRFFLFSHSWHRKVWTFLLKLEGPSDSWRTRWRQKPNLQCLYACGGALW